MGFFLDGVWHDKWYDTDKTKGRFQREPTRFHNWITPDGAPGPEGAGGFAAEAGRYHLYVSLACPWAHRTLIFRKLKKLEDLISVSVVSPMMFDKGWTFNRDEGSTGDHLYDAATLGEIYLKSDAKYSGRVTVPVLWDRQRKTIVNNESSQIIRMLNTAFDAITGDKADFYPQALREDIDAINARVYETVNNGVYRCGFATTQEAYEEAFGQLFDTLDMLDERLSKQRYLCGSAVTEADWRLFPTLVRFDAVYVGHFKCNLRRIEDYSNLSNYTRELFQWPGVAETVDLAHIKRHYYGSHRNINPTGIVPLGPALDFMRPHDRGRFG
ncbi:glutathione S-transferase family protein [Pseudorhodoplanes sp.]|uniref:glutathione S-transferase family protein n=1 Tax=Pseudorhodoplanes sp. TaxID=1934341 RepID=UPI00391BDD60